MTRTIRIASFIFIFVIIMITLFFWQFARGSYIEASSVIVNQIKVLDNKIEVQGTTSNSSIGFSGYKYKTEDGNLYVQLRYSFASKLNPSGDFNIHINDVNNIKNVYIQGRNPKDLSLIWKR